MTILIGVLCQDGVVIGADSSYTFSVNPTLRTIEQPFPGKIQILEHSVIVAGTGCVGLIQRFTAEVHELWTKKAFSKQQHSRPMGAAEAISKAVLTNFHATGVSQAELGALVAFPFSGKCYLFEYAQLQPEEKTPDLWYVSLGSGQLIADSLLALIRHVFWHEGRPSCSEAIFATTWVLDHVIDNNTGGINGPARIATLTLNAKGEPNARLLTEEEIVYRRQYVDGLKEHMRAYQAKLNLRGDVQDIPKR